MKITTRLSAKVSSYFALSLGLAGTATADLVSIFTYDADASTTTGSIPSSLMAGGVITDVSGAGNNGNVIGSTVSTVEDDPFDAAGQLSFRFTSGSDNRLITNAIDLLTVADVAANGGYTISAHFKTTQTTGFGQFLAYAGTDGFRLQNGATQFIASANGGSPNPNVTYDLEALTGGDLQDGNWHQVTARFDTLGNGVVSGQVQGEFTFIIDGTTYGPVAGSFDDFGEVLNRPIGVGGRAVGGDQFDGLVYNPSISLGIAGPNEEAPPEVIDISYTRTVEPENVLVSITFISSDMKTYSLLATDDLEIPVDEQTNLAAAIPGTSDADRTIFLIDFNALSIPLDTLKQFFVIKEN